ncbi:MAG: restriction endonuclease [Fibrobacteres bacterium]|nr:restriction endonuclease [Fibrobacterota bacterium]
MGRDRRFRNLKVNPFFIGRRKELSWLRERLRWGDHGSPVVLVGPAGVGKSSLLQSYLNSYDHFFMEPLWLDLSSEKDATKAIDKLVHDFEEARREDRPFEETMVVLDGADALTDKQLSEATDKIFNWKRVKSLAITMRRRPEIRRAKVLELEPLDSDAAEILLQRVLSSFDFSQKHFEQAMKFTQGNPLAISLLADLLESGGKDNFERILLGNLYDLSEKASQDQIVSVVKPTIVMANEALLHQLKKQPNAIFDLSPRKFEEVLAEILTDMGWEVELTKATRDGGKDILAYQKTELGRLLCLVEAKRYREDRKVGVDLVRSLYGTLCDYQASSAMMVTTSSFSADAQAFQQKHQYQLALRDYFDLARWIQGYKKSGR